MDKTLEIQMLSSFLYNCSPKIDRKGKILWISVKDENKDLKA